MKAVRLDAFGASPALRGDVPEPSPGAGQVLVRVQTSSANPVDNAIASGMLKDMLPHDLPITLGRDFAGVVEQIGDGVSAVSVGDAVFGVVPMMIAAVHDGAWAELILAGEQTLTRKPGSVDTAVAGVAGLGAGTAVLLVDALELSQGDTVLVVGATGGVGSLAVQLAVAAGANVIAPGRTDDAEFLRELGVSAVVDRDADVVAAVRERHADGVDAIIDNVSMGTTGTYDAALKDGGRVASATNAAGEGPGRTNVMHAPSPELFERVVQHLADGTLTIRIQETYELARAHEALEALGTGHTQGKHAIRVA
jgi:NADPH2:quinone reductase